MEDGRQIFKTLIRKDHKFSENKYVHGRVYGIAEIICEFDGGLEEKPGPDGEIRTVRKLRGIYCTNVDETIRYLRIRCTAEQYEKFKDYIEGQYPGLCEFYWEEN